MVITDDQDGGLQLWPYEEDPAAVLPISFTEGEIVKDAFEHINLKHNGILKMESILSMGESARMARKFLLSTN